jgi:peptidyl-prolyl cis-trans isomerase C
MAGEVNAAHILVKTQDKALEVLDKLKTGGRAFGELAKEYSECPSKKRAGQLGWFGRGKMVREFEKAAFELKKGEVSEPIKTQFGWHIIKVLDVR